MKKKNPQRAGKPSEGKLNQGSIDMKITSLQQDAYENYKLNSEICNENLDAKRHREEYMDYLPEGFENLKSSNAYWKMSEMKLGENRFRIVQRPIAGWIDWDGNKPLRFKPHEKPEKPIDATKPVKKFWTFYVWDYAREGLYILEVTQTGIQKSLVQYAKDAEWGDYTNYDFKLVKEGSGKDTKYMLSPVPPKPMGPKIVEALKDSPVNLEALFVGGDPWNCTPQEVEKKDAGGVISKEHLEELMKLTEGNTDYRHRLLDWLRRKHKIDSFDKITLALWDDIHETAKQNFNNQKKEKKAS